MKNLFKRGKKIDQEDLVEIKKREELINQHILIAQALQNEMRGFLGSKMSKYGLDSQKNWSFNTKNGTIEEVKQPMPQQAQPAPAPLPDPATEPKKVKKNK